MIESIQQEDINLSAALYFDDDQEDINVEDPMAIVAHLEKDTMYWDEVMRQPDAPKLLEAAMKEMTTHSELQHWVVVHIADVPKGKRVLHAVWSINRKQ
jgi:hypothetical protein